MKKLHLFGMAVLGALVLASCGSSKNMAVQSNIEKQRSLEGEKVMVETTKLTGYDKSEGLNEDGTDIVKVAYKWFAGIGKADDKQTAIEIAELEARATISRVVENIVKAESERASLTNNSETQKAISSYWKQVSTSIQNACEPYGDTKIEYSPTTKMYTVTQKVACRGDKYIQMLNNASNYKPNNLSGKDLDEFIKVNKSIMEAAKGN
ncbi:MAG: hypothetical protein IJT45_01560 [Bacteroidales bacterium]|nr:hypothetical protein [Bacteroidales bacterium]